jgi:hypothetical protein
MNTRKLPIAIAVAFVANVAAVLGDRLTDADAAGPDVRVILEAETKDDLQSLKSTGENLLNSTQDLDKLIRQLTILSQNTAPGLAGATEARLRALAGILAEANRISGRR